MRKILATTFAAILIAGVTASIPAYASAPKEFKAGLSCLGKDKVAGACLPKNRRSYGISVESNFMLSCINSAKSGLGSSAANYCGCTLVAIEKMWNLSQFSAVENSVMNGGTTPQSLRNIAAACMP
jgi:hypothetical protein